MPASETNTKLIILDRDGVIAKFGIVMEEDMVIDPASHFWADPSTPAVADYTSFAGSTCALPFLTDAYGLYYNQDMFDKANITEPPKTMSELIDVAKKLTVFNPDGSIKVAGFVPYMAYYETNVVTISSHRRTRLGLRPVIRKGT